jgi:hypothetical protein
MTDHDQTALELLYERRKTTYLRHMVIALFVALLASIANGAFHGYQLGLDIAALAAKCGPEAR